MTLLPTKNSLIPDEQFFLKFLHLNEEESEYFNNLSSTRYAVTSKKREILRSRIAFPKNIFNKCALDLLQLISESDLNESGTSPVNIPTLKYALDNYWNVYKQYLVLGAIPYLINGCALTANCF